MHTSKLLLIVSLLSLSLPTQAHELQNPLWVSKLAEFSRIANVFAAHDIIYSCSDFEGRTWAGNDIYLSRFLIGPNSINEFAVVSGQNFVFRDGSIKGLVGAAQDAFLNHFDAHGIVVGRNCAAREGSGYCQYWTQGQSQSIKVGIAQMAEDLRAISDQIDNQAQENGRVTKVIAGQLAVDVAPNAAPISYFRVSAEEASTVKSVTISAPRGRIVVINIEGDGVVKLENIGDLFTLTGGIEADTVVANFPQASRLTLRNEVMFGTFIIPHGTVTFEEGRIEGNLYARDVLGNPMETNFIDPILRCDRSGGQINAVPFRP